MCVTKYPVISGLLSGIRWLFLEGLCTIFSVVFLFGYSWWVKWLRWLAVRSPKNSSCLISQFYAKIATFTYERWVLLPWTWDLFALSATCNTIITTRAIHVSWNTIMGFPDVCICIKISCWIMDSLQVSRNSLSGVQLWEMSQFLCQWLPFYSRTYKLLNNNKLRTFYIKKKH